MSWLFIMLTNVHVPSIWCNCFSILFRDSKKWSNNFLWLLSLLTLCACFVKSNLRLLKFCFVWTQLWKWFSVVNLMLLSISNIERKDVVVEERCYLCVQFFWSWLLRCHQRTFKFTQVNFQCSSSTGSFWFLHDIDSLW